MGQAAGNSQRIGGQTTAILVGGNEGQALLGADLDAGGIAAAKVADTESFFAVTAHSDNVGTVFGTGR